MKKIGLFVFPAICLLLIFSGCGTNLPVTEATAPGTSKSITGTIDAAAPENQTGQIETIDVTDPNGEISKKPQKEMQSNKL